MILQAEPYSEKQSQTAMMSGLALRFAVCVLVGLSAVTTVPAETPGGVEKQRVLILGDSLMRSVSRSFRKQLADIEYVEPVFLVCLGSGLARLDLFDWHTRIEELVKENKPTAAIVFIGANDDQPMKTGKGIILPGTDDWSTEYSRRVARTMDMMLEGGVKRLYWIGLPDMRDPKLQRDSDMINQIAANQVRSRSKVRLIDTARMFSREPGKFSAYVYKEDGMPLHVRDPDGVHLNRKGADWLVGKILPYLLNDLPARKEGVTQ